ncbi:hypothetical protein E3N88_21435 [Mikania micrantha]|uniref:Transposase, Ptta/En/Spm, plant n=1 Tax=Mikania micrantha TaxID=192012 RepID=A0A5N6NJW9_9ASTR|nr:hypothetical protein E3N88_21435 [Mikania micrantha]
MRRLRVKSTDKARADGHDIAERDYTKFRIIRDYPPDTMPLEMWRDLCMAWDTKEWLKRSTSGTSNRASTDSSGLTSRHTGGSIGFDEHRINMEAYLSAMTDMYGPDFTEDNADVRERVRERVQAKDPTSRYSNQRVYGIGDSDINFVVTGAPSSSRGVPQSYAEHRQSQENVKDLESQVHNLGSQLEIERKLREESEQRLEQRLREQHELAQENMRRQMQEFISNFGPRDKN